MRLQSKLINVIGPVGTIADGYAFHNRAFIKMLYTNGFNIKATSMEPTTQGVPLSEDSEIIKILTESKNKPDGDVTVNFCIPPLYRIYPGKVNIGYTTWETSKLHPDWVNSMNQMSAIITPSEAMVKIFRDSGVRVPIYDLGYPINFDLFNKDNNKITISNTQVKPVTFMFSGNWIARKNIEDLIYSFCEVFDNIEDVCLIIKTWAGNNDVNARMHIENAVRNLANKMNGCSKRPKIFVSTDIVEDQDLVAILNGCDVYVTTSRSEGLDTGLLQAMALGKIVVTDRLFGHADYVNSSNALIFDSIYRPVMDSGVPFCNTQQKWGSPVYETLCLALYTAYSVYKSGDPNKLGYNAHISIKNRYSDKIQANIFENILLRTISSSEQKSNKGTGKELVRQA